MQLPPQVNLALTIVSGLCWTMVYVLVIYRSVKDKTYGMPFWALAFNISWEFIFSVVFASRADPTQLIVNRVWLGFDAFILAAYFAYGIKEWPSHVPRIFFYPYSLVVLATSYLFVYLITLRFDEYTGLNIAFIQNLMMSWLFIAMLNKRGNLSGQSLGIAVLKMLGTLAPAIEFAGRSRFVFFLGAGCFLADCIYIAMIATWKQQRQTEH